MRTTEFLPKVDIICPSRNSSAHIEEMIVSVLSQNYTNTGLFIQDGGSTDDTLNIIKKYPVIKWNSDKDNGISQALNRAISATSGDIIGFTSSDDLLAPGAVKAVVAEFSDPAVVMVYGDCNVINKNGKIFKIWKSNEFNLDMLFWKNYIPYQTVYVRRSSLDVTGLFDENLKLAQDYDLWLRFGANFNPKSIKYFPCILASYRMAFGSAGLSNFSTGMECIDASVNKFFCIYNGEKKLKKSINHSLAGIMLMKSDLALLGSDMKTSNKLFFKSLLFYPEVLLTSFFWKQLVRILIGRKMVIRLKQSNI